MRSKKEIKSKISALHDNRRYWIRIQNEQQNKEEISLNKAKLKEQESLKMIELLG